MGRRKPKKNKTRKRRRPRRTLTPRPAVKRVNADALKETIDRARTEALSEEECAELRSVVETLEYVVRELDEKNLTVRRLRSLFGLAGSEKLRKIFPDEPEMGDDGADNDPAEPTPADQPGAGDGATDDAETKNQASGHGRNGAKAYTGAERIEVPHSCLKPGAPCPTCKRGKVYEQRHRPHLLVRVEGQPPLKATVYEMQAFRCNLCGEVFAADPPDGVGEEKYDTTSAAMIGLLKYGSGLPFNRLERLEEHLGVPLPASTQWEIVRDAVVSLGPAYDELIYAAAQGELLHNDDTSMRVLSLMKENEELRRAGQTKARTGIHVTGIVSVTGERRIALFFTGRKHAGENLQVVLDQRARELPPPLQMSDGLDTNDPKHAETIRGCCLAHSRRKFAEVADSFPSECLHVLREIGKVYKNDDRAQAGELDPQARLNYHVEHSKPVLDVLETWLNQQLDDHLVEPNSSLGGAINYMLNHWDELTLFLREPGAPLDNNVCERGLKKAILHRKNALFYKTLNGARAGDVFMSLIHTAELARENPFEYLVALLDHTDAVAADPAAWLPWSFRATLAAADA